MSSTGIAKPNVPASQQAQTMIQALAPRFAQAMGKRVGVDKLASIVALAVAGNRALEECSAASIVQSAYRAAMLNLSPDPNLGEAYLVPYKGVATLQLGYKGMIKLAIRGGVRRIYAQLVREGEPFAATLGIHPDLTHTPGYDADAPVTHAYAVAWLASGEVDFEVLAWSEIMAIKARSKAGNNGPWVTDPGEMAKKTAIRRLCKRLNLEYESPDAVALVTADDDAVTKRVFSPTLPELDAAADSTDTEPTTEESSGVPPPPPPAPPPPPKPAPKRQAPPPPPPTTPLLSGSAILGPLTEGLAPATVLAWIQSWDPPGCPATATSLDQVRQEYLAMVQSDPQAWKSQLDAYLAR